MQFFQILLIYKYLTFLVGKEENSGLCLSVCLSLISIRYFDDKYSYATFLSYATIFSYIAYVGVVLFHLLCRNILADLKKLFVFEGHAATFFAKIRQKYACTLTEISKSLIAPRIKKKKKLLRSNQGVSKKIKYHTIIITPTIYGIILTTISICQGYGFGD